MSVAATHGEGVGHQSLVLGCGDDGRSQDGGQGVHGVGVLVVVVVAGLLAVLRVAAGAFVGAVFAVVLTIAHPDPGDADARVALEVTLSTLCMDARSARKRGNKHRVLFECVFACLSRRKTLRSVVCGLGFGCHVCVCLCCCVSFVSQKENYGRDKRQS